MSHLPQRSFSTWLSLCVLGVATASAPALAAEKSLISIEDLYRVDSPTGLVVSPDGKSAVYARRWAQRSTRSIRHSLWRVDGEAAKRVPMEEGEPDVRQPLFSPDGEWIAFLSSRPFPDGTPTFLLVPAYSDPAADIWVIRRRGGRAIPLATRSKPYGRVFSDPFYGRMAFSADGKRLAFVADDGLDPRSPREIDNNVEVVRDDQGEGYEGYGPAQIWVADLAAEPGQAAAARITRVTNDSIWYGDPQWTPDGGALIVHANRTRDRESVRFSINKNYDLWRIDLSSRKLRQLTSGPGPQVSPRLSPDGKRLLCLSIPRRGSHMDVFNLLVMNFDDAIRDAGAGAEVLLDHHAIKTDARPAHLQPLFPLPTDAWITNDRFSYNGADRTATRVQVIDLSQRAAAVADSENPELARRARTRQSLAPPGDLYLRDRIVAQGEVVRWKSFDGQEIEGVLTLPPPGAPDAKKPHKMVLYPHGGPHGRSALGFDFTVQVLAAHGYAVFQPNFRGSSGYGQKFIDADRGDFGGGDMRDILTGIEHLVSQGAVDPKRQFVYGVSYGGFMTSWLIGHTHQFRAAVPQNAVTDLVAMWGLSDLQSWTEWEFRGRPWEVPQAMRDHSPLTYASRVRTPTLILHAANDRRCPLPMGKMFYRALERSGVETEMVIYPNEGHGIKQLPHQEDVLRRVLDWFARHDVAAKRN